MLKRQEDNKGQVIIFGNLEYADTTLTEKRIENTPTVEIETIRDILKDRIITDTKVLPICDAQQLVSDNGIVYAYNCSLRYLNEIKHLADVENNIIVGQAFMYQGRNTPSNKPPIFQWFLVVSIVIMSIFAIVT